MAYFSHSSAAGLRASSTPAADSLPIIDISGLRGGHAAKRARVAEEIGRAAHHVGMFYVRGHGIERDLIERVYTQARAFFALPEQVKLESHIARSRNHRGYVPFSEKGDYADEQGERLYEAFDSGLELSATHPAALASPLAGPNVWPLMVGFKNTVTEYYNAIAELGQLMCRAFEHTLGVKRGYFDAFMRAPASQLRLLHYVENDAPPRDEQMQMGAHTDYECFTLLHQGGPGLQSMSVDKQWVDVPPIDDTFVVNIGDMLEVWSNGYFVSNPHRVLNTGKERFSMPFFVAADYDAVIEPVPTAQRAFTARRYAPVVAGEHLINQLMRDFPYLRNRPDLRDFSPSPRQAFVNPFEHAKLGDAAISRAA